MAQSGNEKNKSYDALKQEEEYKVGTVSEKSWTLTMLLAVFFGAFGIHRFYVGKLCTGILYFCTVGCVFVGWLGDIWKIARGEFTDSDGRYIRRNK